MKEHLRKYIKGADLAKTFKEKMFPAKNSEEKGVEPQV